MIGHDTDSRDRERIRARLRPQDRTIVHLSGGKVHRPQASEAPKADSPAPKVRSFHGRRSIQAIQAIRSPKRAKDLEKLRNVRSIL